MAAETAHRDDLGTLSDPGQHHGAISLDAPGAARAKRLLRTMLLIRRCEERIAQSVETGQVKCPCHLAIGQEAVAVAMADHLRPTDKCFGAHRSHAHYLALGGAPDRMMAEILGRDSGCSRGMGGSMHLRDERVGLVGTVPIVAATIPMAVGAGLALRMDGGVGVAVAFFGDGATEEGAFHEAMNLAASLPSPTVFVCEHNLFSSHLHISLRQPASRVARYAEAHCMPHLTLDGNDLGRSWEAAGDAVRHARETRRPFFLEFVTYRWRGHVGHREDTDVGVRRKDDLGQWKRRDPIRRCAEALEALGELVPGELERIDAEIRGEVEAAWRFGEAAEDPAPAELLSRVFAGGSNP